MKDLLLQLCQYPFEPSKKDHLKVLLNQVEDWRKCVELINAHGIIALAAYNIKEAELQLTIPAEAFAALENGYRQNVVRNAWLVQRWKEVSTILTNAGIKHVLLKGMALEHTVYGSIGLRQMTDNDILIRHDDALRAWKILKENGYQTETPKSPLHRKILADINKHLPTLIKDDYSLEIHSRLPGIDDHEVNTNETIFNDAPEISIDGMKAFILPDDIHLRYLINHFERHRSEGQCQLRSFADIMILSEGKDHQFPDEFISDPDQSGKPEFSKTAFRSAVKSIPPPYRLRYLAGDIFPSIRWMKERYGCGSIKAALYYPLRIGKLIRIL